MAITIALQPATFFPQAALSLGSADYPKMYEIAQKVHDDPSLIAEFDADPLAAAVKINGFAPPTGYHMHIVDENNIYHPAEGSSQEQIAGGTDAWARMEARAGYAKIACIICLWCGGKMASA